MHREKDKNAVILNQDGCLFEVEHIGKDIITEVTSCSL